MEKKPASGAEPAKAGEVHVTVHCADNGPGLASCMISILSDRLSKGAGL